MMSVIMWLSLEKTSICKLQCIVSIQNLTCVKCLVIFVNIQLIKYLLLLLGIRVNYELSTDTKLKDFFIKLSENDCYFSNCEVNNMNNSGNVGKYLCWRSIFIYQGMNIYSL